MPKASGKTLLFSLTSKDFIVETYRGSGNGGQHRNKVESCVRIRHPQSGAHASACETPHQHQNKRMAFRRLVETADFKNWHRRYTASLLMPPTPVDTVVDMLMLPHNIKIEVLTEDGWVPKEEF